MAQRCPWNFSHVASSVCVAWCQLLPRRSPCSSANRCASNRKSLHCRTNKTLFTQTAPKQDIWLLEVFFFTHCKLVAKQLHRTRWHSGRVLCENLILLRVGVGSRCNRSNPKHGPTGCWHEKWGCQARHAVIWPWRTDCNCTHSCFESVSGHPLSVNGPAVSLSPCQPFLLMALLWEIYDPQTQDN